jgi:hypothetical protein
MMRELTTEQRAAMEKAYNEANPANAKRGFAAGFTAGLEFQQPAAPDLVAACRAAVENCETCGRLGYIEQSSKLEDLLDCPACSLARAALARVRSEL